jgi:hypothetical protein
MDSFQTIITCHVPDVQLSSINSNRVVASWNDIKTSVKYEYVVNKSATPPAFGTDLHKTSILTSFLDEGTQYYVHVRAHCNTIYSTSDWKTVPFNTWALSTGNITAEGKILSVYPNPVQREVVITVPGIISGKGTVKVMDMTGKVLRTNTVNRNRMEMNLGDLPSGMYILQYTDDIHKEQVKFTRL